MGTFRFKSWQLDACETRMRCAPFIRDEDQSFDQYSNPTQNN